MAVSSSRLKQIRRSGGFIRRMTPGRDGVRPRIERRGRPLLGPPRRSVPPGPPAQSPLGSGLTAVAPGWGRPGHVSGRTTPVGREAVGRSAPGRCRDDPEPPRWRRAGCRRGATHQLAGQPPPAPSRGRRPSTRCPNTASIGSPTPPVTATGHRRNAQQLSHPDTGHAPLPGPWHRLPAPLRAARPPCRSLPRNLREFRITDGSGPSRPPWVCRLGLESLYARTLETAA
jgi:hypothetical protein